MLKTIALVAAAGAAFFFAFRKKGPPSEFDDYEWLGDAETSIGLGSVTPGTSMDFFAAPAAALKKLVDKKAEVTSEAERAAINKEMEALMAASARVRGRYLGIKKSKTVVAGKVFDVMYGVMQVDQILFNSMNGSPDVGDYVAMPG